MNLTNLILEVIGVQSTEIDKNGNIIPSRRQQQEFYNKKISEKEQSKISKEFGNAKDIIVGKELDKRFNLYLSSEEQKMLGKFVKNTNNLPAELSNKILKRIIYRDYLGNSYKEDEQLDRTKEYNKTGKTNINNQWKAMLFSGANWCISLPKGTIFVKAEGKLSGLDFVGFNNGVYYAIEAKNNYENSVEYCSSFIRNILKLNNQTLIPYVIHRDKSLFKEDIQEYVHSENEFKTLFPTFSRDFEEDNANTLKDFSEVISIYKQKYKKDLFPSGLFNISNKLNKNIVIKESYFNY